MRPSLARLCLSSFLCVCLDVPALTAQVSWIDRSPLNGPPPRYNHAMAYDENRGVVVLFGGRAQTGILSDTWEWDGFLWTQKTPKTRPSAREQASMAYDGNTKKILLFGGGGLADTWTWDGVTWARATPTRSPSVRNSAAMAYDKDRKVVVLYGGHRSVSHADTWEWNGTTWTDRNVSGPPKGAGGLAYDASRKETFLYIGSQTWVWNGKAWTRRFPAGFASGHTLAYDPWRRRVLQFGGSRLLNDLWEWNGAEWRLRHVQSPPRKRQWTALAYDTRRRRLVLFGGSADGTAWVGDTWELAADCFCVGEGHPGGGAPISCVSPPVLGATFRIAFSAPQGRSTLFVGPAPLGSTGLPVSPPLVCTAGTFYPQPLATLRATGKPAVLNLPVPGDPQLAGVRVTVQAASPRVLGCLELTDAIEVTLRHR